MKGIPPVPPPRAIILASASPRRADLLRLLGLEFSVRPVAIDETPRPGESPDDLVERLARSKAGAITGRFPGPVIVIGADTLVVAGGVILGKPEDRDDAARMLASLAGRTHDVVTAVAVRAVPEEAIACERCVSRVTFAPMTRAEIDWYAGSGEGLDKAGAYALQGRGAMFVTSVEGSYTNVIGLPVDRLYPLLKTFGFLLPDRHPRP
ncbi:MAG TPA: Maf family protein [Candidatus Polarisedimenticolia bacterium]|nr:Maf family protein [Candidatus Polarisedimenticolia bacterium]